MAMERDSSPLATLSLRTLRWIGNERVFVRTTYRQSVKQTFCSVRFVCLSFCVRFILFNEMI